MMTTVLMILYAIGTTLLIIGVICKLNELPYHQALMIAGLGINFAAGLVYWFYAKKKAKRG